MFNDVLGVEITDLISIYLSADGCVYQDNVPVCDALMRKRYKM